MCRSPYYHPDYKTNFPCGSCEFCRMKRSRDWVTRLLNEKEYHKNCSFVTLTYSNENLPEKFSLNHKDVQLCLKRIRHNGFRFKYFIAGEYGEKTNRPHYHMIVYGMSVAESKVQFEECWQKGYIHVGSVTDESCAYCSQYALKKQYKKDFYGDRKPPYLCVSKGLGKQYAIDHANTIAKDLFFMKKGYKQSYPRYYFKVLNLDREELYKETVNEYNKKIMKEMEAECKMPFITNKINKNSICKIGINVNNVINNYKDYVRIDKIYEETVKKDDILLKITKLTLDQRRKIGIYLTVDEVDYDLTDEGYLWLVSKRHAVSNNIRARMKHRRDKV